MGWTSNHIASEHRMELTLKGKIDYDTLLEAVLTNVEKSNEFNALNHLVDCTALIADFDRRVLFELPNKLYPEWGMVPTTRIALIEPRTIDAKGKAEFYVYAMKKLGWDTAIFSNRKKALTWLNQS